MPARAGLAAVLRTFCPAFLASHTLNIGQDRVWRAIVACRTPALGGQVESCAQCGSTRFVYHSCRNRHCPLCQTRAKESWLAARRQELLPVPYFHVVFTLPHALHCLVGQHAVMLYELLFRSAAATLTTFAANPRWLGGTPAFSLVLHTWKQDLGRHLHVHALVAGGALTAAGEWVQPRRGFLFPVKALSKVFRGKFIAALEQERTVGPLRRDTTLTAGVWQQLLAQLYEHDWVVYAKQPLGGPAQVLEYLSRYTHRVAISNERILGIGDDTVTLRVRGNGQGSAKRTMHVPGPEFIARFLQHVLPRGFKRIRHYGLLGPAHKAGHLAAARTALAAPAPMPKVIETVAAFLLRVAKIEWSACPHCSDGRFVVVQALAPEHWPSSARAPP